MLHGSQRIPHNMIEFMILSAPRSGSTWASVWLTTDTTLCVHDPLWTRHYSELDAIEEKGKAIGLSCTGLALFPDWVNAHPARKIVLHRDHKEINESLALIGFSPREEIWDGMLDRINGIHRPWKDLFNTEAAKDIYEHLLQIPFDEARHSHLREVEMQPKFAGLTVGKEVTNRLITELRSI